MNVNLFSNIEYKCCSDKEKCLCTKTEMALRRYAEGDDILAMNEEQRLFCIEQAEFCSEGYYSVEELTKMSDTDLARSVIHSWAMYII
jgi:hypothetical protein